VLSRFRPPRAQREAAESCGRCGGSSASSSRNRIIKLVDKAMARTKPRTKG